MKNLANKFISEKIEEKFILNEKNKIFCLILTPLNKRNIWITLL